MFSAKLRHYLKKDEAVLKKYIYTVYCIVASAIVGTTDTTGWYIAEGHLSEMRVLLCWRTRR